MNAGLWAVANTAGDQVYYRVRPAGNGLRGMYWGFSSGYLQPLTVGDRMPESDTLKIKGHVYMLDWLFNIK